MRLDDLIESVNGDLQDCLVQVRNRFRQAMSEIFDYAVANPAQGSAATAQTDIATAFKVHYADGLVAPGITIESAVAAFNNRHGGTGTANQKWVTIRDFIVARSAHKERVAEWLEEGTLPALERLWLDKVRASDDVSVPTLIKNSDGFVTKRVYVSTSVGKTVTVDYGTTADAQGIARPNYLDTITVT